MGKVHYVQGRYRDAQGMCARVGLEELTKDDQPTYHLRLLAEAFVIKGTSGTLKGHFFFTWVVFSWYFSIIAIPNKNIVLTKPIA